jgi:hypothetical protein
MVEDLTRARNRLTKFLLCLWGACPAVPQPMLDRSGAIVISEQAIDDAIDPCPVAVPDGPQDALTTKPHLLQGAPLGDVRRLGARLDPIRRCRREQVVHELSLGIRSAAAAPVLGQQRDPDL